LNRRELHTCFPNIKPEGSTSKTSVTSLDKRDRQSLFQRTDISVDPANSAAHVSLSSNLQLSNNRPDQTQSKTYPSSKTLRPQTHQHRSQSGNTEPKVTVASSAAALVL
jgi:hypothetical protein